VSDTGHQLVCGGTFGPNGALDARMADPYAAAFRMR